MSFFPRFGLSPQWKSIIYLENLFNLKFAAKELERSAKRCEKDAVTEKAKLKRAIEQGNMEGAKIYAENVIRNKNQA